MIWAAKKKSIKRLLVVTPEIIDKCVSLSVCLCNVSKQRMSDRPVMRRKRVRITRREKPPTDAVTTTRTWPWSATSGSEKHQMKKWKKDEWKEDKLELWLQAVSPWKFKSTVTKIIMKFSWHNAKLIAFYFIQNFVCYKKYIHYIWTVLLLMLWFIIFHLYI